MSEKRCPERVDIEEYTNEIHKPYLFNYADGIDGHYCIARKALCGQFEFWGEPDNWILAPNGERDIVGHVFGYYSHAVNKLCELRDAMVNQDAERYRYLRNVESRSCLDKSGPDAGVWCDCEDENGILVLLTEDDLDKAIDAAIAAQRAKQ